MALIPRHTRSGSALACDELRCGGAGSSGGSHGRTRNRIQALSLTQLWLTDKSRPEQTRSRGNRSVPLSHVGLEEERPLLVNGVSGLRAEV